MGGKPLPRASRFGSRGKCGVALHKTRAKPSRTQQREGRDGAEEAGGRRDPRGGDGVNLQRPRPAGGPVTRPRRKMEAGSPHVQPGTRPHPAGTPFSPAHTRRPEAGTLSILSGGRRARP